MADGTQKKRGPGRPPGSKNKTNHAAAPNRNEQIDEMQRKFDRDRRNVDVIWSITLVAIGLFLFFTVVMDTTGSFGMYIHDFCLGLFGLMAYALPFLVFIFAILLLAGKLQHIGWRTILFSFLIFINLCILNSYRFIDENDIRIGFADIAEQYRNAISGIEGGVIGMELGGILVKLFGKPGLIIIALAVLIISVFLVANTPISRFVEKSIKNRERKKILSEMNESYEAEIKAQIGDSKPVYTSVMPEPVATERRKGVRAVDMQDTIVMSKDEFRELQRQHDESGIIGSVKSVWRSLVGGLTNDDSDLTRIPSNNVRLNQDFDKQGTRMPANTGIPEPFGSRSAKNGRGTSSLDPFSGEEKMTSAQSRVIVQDKNPSEIEAEADRDTFFGKLAKRFTGYVNGSDDRDFDREEDNYGYPGDKKRIEQREASAAVRPGFGLGDPDEIIHSGSYGLDGHIKKTQGVDAPPLSGGNAAGSGVAAVTAASRENENKEKEKKTAKASSSAKTDTNKQPKPDAAGAHDKDDAEIIAGFDAKMEDADYELPPVSLLKRGSGPKHVMSSSEIGEKAALLEKTLNDFGVDAKVINVTQGASVTRYEVQPATGVKVSKITGLSDDIALNMRAKTVRIEAPIPGKAAVGIEVENEKPSPVLIRELIDSDEFMSAPSRIEFVVGKDISGNNIVADMKDMPHLLVAGATGSGKSVCINSIIASFMYKAKPSELKLIMIDPKMVELGNYNGIPHMLTPVVTDPRKAARALAIAVDEMEKRYELFSKENVKDLESYNEKMRAVGRYPDCKPEIVIIIDELADLMMAAPSEVENAIIRLAQKARAAGMHLIIATQRPSVDVVTGLIKANVPSRIAFTTTSSIDSRTILDMTGAEKLLGKGDMLFSPVGSTKPYRVQGPYISAEETEKIIKFVKKEGGEPEYDEELRNAIENNEQKSSSEPQDELTEDAIDFIFKSGQASVSMLQRRFRIGYNRAARIIDEIEEKGIIGPQDGARARQLLISEEMYYGGLSDIHDEPENDLSDEAYYEDAPLDAEEISISDITEDTEYIPEEAIITEDAEQIEETEETEETEEPVVIEEPEEYEAFELPETELDEVMDLPEDSSSDFNKSVSANTGVNAFNSLSPEQQARILDADYEDEY